VTTTIKQRLFDEPKPAMAMQVRSLQLVATIERMQPKYSNHLAIQCVVAKPHWNPRDSHGECNFEISMLTSVSTEIATLLKLNVE
jgi:hypothetical protein